MTLLAQRPGFSGLYVHKFWSYALILLTAGNSQSHPLWVMVINFHSNKALTLARSVCRVPWVISKGCEGPWRRPEGEGSNSFLGLYVSFRTHNHTLDTFKRIRDLLTRLARFRVRLMSTF